MKRQHHYKATLTWTGNQGEGTISSSKYQRSHTVEIQGKPLILASSDVPFRGESTKHNPEDFFISALSACHMLWYLHLCADAGVVVTAYIDEVSGTMEEKETAGGYFSEVILHPVITLQYKSMQELAEQMHQEANKKCFIANSCNFPVQHKAIYRYEQE
jgi:organic hydroperoxide reductase OsmC/OhrA